jgi:putative acetyltransferase
MKNNQGVRLPHVLRLGLPEDALAILEVYRSAVHGLPEKFYSREVIGEWAPIKIRPEHVKRRAQEIASGETIVVMAEGQDGSVAGFGALEPGGALLRDVYVRPDRGHAGVGRTILKRLEDVARDMGLEMLNLTASVNAEAFFAANGFVVDSRGGIFLDSGVTMDCVLMHKPLIALGRLLPEHAASVSETRALRAGDPFPNLGQQVCDALNEHHRSDT